MAKVSKLVITDTSTFNRKEVMKADKFHLNGALIEVRRGYGEGELVGLMGITPHTLLTIEEIEEG